MVDSDDLSTICDFWKLPIDIGLARLKNVFLKALLNIEDRLARMILVSYPKDVDILFDINIKHRISSLSKDELVKLIDSCRPSWYNDIPELRNRPTRYELDPMLRQMIARFSFNNDIRLLIPSDTWQYDPFKWINELPMLLLPGEINIPANGECCDIFHENVGLMTLLEIRMYRVLLEEEDDKYTEPDRKSVV